VPVFTTLQLSSILTPSILNPQAPSPIALISVKKQGQRFCAVPEGQRVFISTKRKKCAEKRDGKVVVESAPKLTVRFYLIIKKIARTQGAGRNGPKEVAKQASNQTGKLKRPFVTSVFP